MLDSALSQKLPERVNVKHLVVHAFWELQWTRTPREGIVKILQRLFHRVSRRIHIIVDADEPWALCAHSIKNGMRLIDIISNHLKRDFVICRGSHVLCHGSEAAILRECINHCLAPDETIPRGQAYMSDADLFDALYAGTIAYARHCDVARSCRAYETFTQSRELVARWGPAVHDSSERGELVSVQNPVAIRIELTGEKCFNVYAIARTTFKKKMKVGVRLLHVDARSEASGAG